MLYFPLPGRRGGGGRVERSSSAILFFSAFDGGLWGGERSSPLLLPPFGIHSSPDSHHSNSRHVTAQVSHSHYGNQCPPFPWLPWRSVTWFPPNLITCGSPCFSFLAWTREQSGQGESMCKGGCLFNHHGNKSTPPGDTFSCCYGNRRTSHSDILPCSQGNKPHPEKGERPS